MTTNDIQTIIYEIRVISNFFINMLISGIQKKKNKKKMYEIFKTAIESNRCRSNLPPRESINQMIVENQKKYI